MKATKNALGGNHILNLISLVIFIVAIFIMVNSDIQVIRINYPKISEHVASGLFWGVGLSLIGVVTLIFSLSRSK